MEPDQDVISPWFEGWK